VIADVKERLKEHQELDVSLIDVYYDHSVVVLTGTVPDEAARQLAEEAARGTERVIAVDNDLELPPPGQ
jgi:osmotically-inducible protein OsmY